MAKCSRCQSETELYNGGVPICLNCANEADATRKRQQPETSDRAAPKNGKAA